LTYFCSLIQINIYIYAGQLIYCKRKHKIIMEQKTKWKASDICMSDMKLLAEVLGVELLTAIMDDPKTARELPDSFPNNATYVSPKWATNTGILQKKKGSLLLFEVPFDVTLIFREKWVELAPITALKDRNSKYLEHKINAYCDYYHYCFCDNNFEHIKSAFTEYYLKKERLSHTTYDVINTFRFELKRAHKNNWK